MRCSEKVIRKVLRPHHYVNVNNYMPIKVAEPYYETIFNDNTVQFCNNRCSYAKIVIVNRCLEIPNKDQKMIIPLILKYIKFLEFYFK